jgi:hypothetical protein
LQHLYWVYDVSDGQQHHEPMYQKKLIFKYH